MVQYGFRCFDFARAYIVMIDIWDVSSRNVTAAATPANESLLRCSVCAAHTKEQLSSVIDKLTVIAYETGLLEAPARVAVS